MVWNEDLLRLKAFGAWNAVSGASGVLRRRGVVVGAAQIDLASGRPSQAGSSCTGVSIQKAKDSMMQATRGLVQVEGRSVES